MALDNTYVRILSSTADAKNGADGAETPPLPYAVTRPSFYLVGQTAAREKRHQDLATRGRDRSGSRLVARTPDRHYRFFRSSCHQRVVASVLLDLLIRTARVFAIPETLINTGRSRSSKRGSPDYAESALPNATEAPDVVGEPSGDRTRDPLIKRRGPVMSRPSPLSAILRVTARPAYAFAA